MARSVRSGNSPARTKESDQAARDAARAAARDAGLSLGKYLNQVILEAGEQGEPTLSGAELSKSQRIDELARRALRETASALRQEGGSPYKSALEMMTQLRDRVAQIESTLEHQSGSPAANDATVAAPWTDRLEEISRQIGDAQRYMVGGMMTVEEALSKLSHRTKALENSVAGSNKLALLTQQIAGHVHSHKQEADTRFADLDAGLSQVKAQLQKLETLVRSRQTETISEPLMDKLTQALEDAAAKEDTTKAAETAYWGTAENPKGEPLASTAPPLLKRKRDTQEKGPTKKASPDVSHRPESGGALFDTALLDEVDIDGITYSLPQSRADEDEDKSVDPFDELDTSDLLETELSPDEDVFLYKQTSEGDEADGKTKISAVTSLRDLLQKSHERENSSHETDTDNVPSEKDLHSQRLRGLLVIIIGFSFLALLAAGYLVLQSAFHKPAVQDGPLPGTEAPKVGGGMPAPRDFSALTQSDQAVGRFAQGENMTAATDITTSSVGGLSDTNAHGIATQDGAALLARGADLLVKESDEATRREGLKLIQEAADQGFPSACYFLGVTYERGFYVDQDYQSARRWYEKAADAGNRKAMHNLAVLHAEGLGVPKDYSIAATWFKKGAQLGLADSQYNLGVLYERGWGVEKDLAQSYKWFSILAKSGDADAKSKSAMLAAQLDGQSRRDIDAEVDAWQPQPLDPAANDQRFL